MDLGLLGKRVGGSTEEGASSEVVMVTSGLDEHPIWVQAENRKQNGMNVTFLEKYNNFMSS